jgi:hypothetical protein
MRAVPVIDLPVRAVVPKTSSNDGGDVFFRLSVRRSILCKKISERDPTVNYVANDQNQKLERIILTERYYEEENGHCSEVLPYQGRMSW